jgi:hypothetical protein
MVNPAHQAELHYPPTVDEILQKLDLHKEQSCNMSTYIAAVP